MANAILVHEGDSVVVAIAPLHKGDDVSYVSEGKEEHLTASTDVPIYHKLARVALKKGDDVIKYGQYIGTAMADIPVGAHVHVHNVESTK